MTRQSVSALLGALQFGSHPACVDYRARTRRFPPGIF